jgi:uncharacterized membrane protein
MIIGLILIAVVGYYFWKNQGVVCNGSKKQDDALAIARVRFARGEIDEETFEAVKRVLSE